MRERSDIERDHSCPVERSHQVSISPEFVRIFEHFTARRKCSRSLLPETGGHLLYEPRIR
jgi:hypothetical protein